MKSLEIQTQTRTNYPLVSIGILTFNNFSIQGTSFLKGFESLLNQSWPNIEVILQDDCSEDNTFEMLKGYEIRYPFLKCFQNKKNLGVGENIKKLVKKVSGVYFLWGCVDDYYEPEYVKRCVGQLMNFPNKTVCQSYIKTLYKDENADHLYIDINNPTTTEEFELLNKLTFKRYEYKGECAALNPLIHGVQLSTCAKALFSMPSLLYFELYIPLLLIFMGGLCVEKEFLFTNCAKKFFKDRYPKSDYVKNSINLKFLMVESLKILSYLFSLKLKRQITISYSHLCIIWCKVSKFYIENIFLNKSIYVLKQIPFLYRTYKLIKSILRNVSER